MRCRINCQKLGFHHCGLWNKQLVHGALQGCQGPDGGHLGSEVVLAAILDRKS